MPKCQSPTKQHMSPSTQNESFQHQKWEFRTANQQLVKALLALTYGPRCKKTRVIRVSTTNNKDADQSTWMRRLVFACVVHNPPPNTGPILLNLPVTILTRKTPAKIHLKILSAFVVCCNFLLTLFKKVKYRDKQCGPRSDCSYRDSLI